MGTISIEGVSKSFKIFHDKGATLKEKILFTKRNFYEQRQVLSNINMRIEKGEVVGLIGKNGCGKSTLLKLMTKIIYPDGGSIKLTGKISSLLELGAGFHPDMSGKENIYMNASIFGLTRVEINERIDDIIAFSELDEFIDNPVRTYSSGMYMRLAFSVAINVDADILLIDEILAVGDVSFQKKCFNRLKDLKVRGTTIIIVSHDLESLKKICNKVYWIQDGEINQVGSPLEVTMSYLDSYNQHEHIEESVPTEECVAPEEEEVVGDYLQRWGNRELEVSNVCVYDSNGIKSDVFKSGESVVVEISYIQHNSDIKESIFGIGFFTNEDLNCYGTNTSIDGIGSIKLRQEGKVRIEIESLSLLDGRYYIDVAMHDESGLPYDYIRGAMKFEVYNTVGEVGLVKLTHKWMLDE